MARKKRAAIRHGIKKSLAKIEGRMPANRQPKRSRTAHGKRKEHGDGHDARFSDQTLTGIVGMFKAEIHRQEQCRGPKSHALRERVQRVSAIGKLLEQTHE